MGRCLDLFICSCSFSPHEPIHQFVIYMMLHVFLIGQSPKGISFLAPLCFFVGQAIGSLISPKVGMNVFTKEKEEDSADALPPSIPSGSSSGLPLPVALGRQTSAATAESPAAGVAGRAEGTEGTEAPGRRLVCGWGDFDVARWVPSPLN